VDVGRGRLEGRGVNVMGTTHTGPVELHLTVRDVAGGRFVGRATTRERSRTVGRAWPAWIYLDVGPMVSASVLTEQRRDRTEERLVGEAERRGS
jgi:hypothetical protein